tara:strand:+ start:513 stop:716 length:204 start_codon:yes stop_codon:yes gene_type:complete
MVGRVLKENKPTFFRKLFFNQNSVQEFVRSKQTRPSIHRFRKMSGKSRKHFTGKYVKKRVLENVGRF